MRLSKGLLALAALTAVPLAAFGLARARKRHEPEPPPEPKPLEAKKPASGGRPNIAEDADGSEPGGTLVVLGMFGILAALATLVAAFVFPPGYVAAVLVFGLVSLLGLVVLYVHFRAHHSAG